MPVSHRALARGHGAAGWLAQPCDHLRGAEWITGSSETLGGPSRAAVHQLRPRPSAPILTSTSGREEEDVQGGGKREDKGGPTCKRPQPGHRRLK